MGRAFFVGMVLVWLGKAALFAARAGAVAPSPGTYTTDLSLAELDHARVLQSVGVRLQRSAFEKEPPLDRRGVYRGSLLWFNRPDQAMPFIWEQARGRLYLDLNRNRDLTDDPQGVCATKAGENNQSFTNVPFVLHTRRGNRAVRLEVNFYSYHANTVRVYAGVCSYWGGRVSLHGQDWQFGLMESMPGGRASGRPDFLVLRPWAEQERPLRLNYSTSDGIDYTTNLFFGGRAYVVECRYVPQGESAKYRVTFTDQAPQLGELQVTGADLHRVILTARPALTVILDQPQGTVKLPVGRYSLAEIWLRKGDAEAGSFRNGTITVDARQPTSVVAGGPLTNCVRVTSRRENLEINYRLVGADGRAYQFPRRDYKHPPEFAIFKGTNRLASGKFQYG